METENKEPKLETRTDSIWEGSTIQHVVVSPTGVRIYKKGGAIINILSPDPKKNLIVEHKVKE